MTIDAGTLANLPERGRWQTQFGNEKLEALLVDKHDQAVVAFRHTLQVVDIDWQTTVVFSSTDSDSWVSIRTDRESAQPQLELPNAKKPYIVRTIIEKLGGGLDAELFVTDQPYWLKSNDAGMVVRLMNGDAENYLPIVYVSRRFDEYLDVDPLPLARALGGIAHVLIEPDRSFSRTIQPQVESNNVYGGRLGVYWPNGNSYRYFLNETTPTEFDLRNLITSRIRSALLHRRPLSRCTWSIAEAEVARVALEALRSSGSNDVEEYVRIFDAEINAKNKQIEDAESEIAKLKSRNFRSSEDRLESPVKLNFGGEQEFLEGEFNEIVGDAIQNYLQAVQSDSRRHDIIQSLVNNSKFSLGLKDRRERLKEILRSYKSMTKDIRTDLEDIGFRISEDGKHFKLIYMDDERYTFALPKSGGDFRGGLNAVSDIGKRIF